MLLCGSRRFCAASAGYSAFYEWIGSASLVLAIATKLLASLFSKLSEFVTRAPILHRKAKLYRFDKDGNQWKERGVGQAKLLEHKDTKRIRLLMRQQRTLKICANHTGVFTWRDFSQCDSGWHMFENLSIISINLVVAAGFRKLRWCV